MVNISAPVFRMVKVVVWIPNQFFYWKGGCHLGGFHQPKPPILPFSLTWNLNIAKNSKNRKINFHQKALHDLGGTGWFSEMFSPENICKLRWDDEIFTTKNICKFTFNLSAWSSSTPQMGGLAKMPNLVRRQGARILARVVRIVFMRDAVIFQIYQHPMTGSTKPQKTYMK